MAKFEVEKKTPFPTLVLSKDRGEQKQEANGEDPEKMHTKTAFDVGSTWTCLVTRSFYLCLS